MDRTRHGGNVRPGRLSISGAFLYPESHLRFAYLIRDCRLEIIALKRCATTASRRLRTGAENRAFPGPVPEPAEGGPGRVLLAEHVRLIEPLARLATKVRRPLTQFQCEVCSVGCGMIIRLHPSSDEVQEPQYGSCSWWTS